MLEDDKKRYGMKEGGPGIEALRKEAPEVVERMGYQEGGSLLQDEDMPTHIHLESYGSLRFYRE